MVAEGLEEAIKLVHEGQIQEAHGLLEGIINSDVHNIQAWLWYAKTCPSPAERQEALEACLHYNPDSPSIKEILQGAAAKHQKAPRPKPTSSTSRMDPSIVNAIQASSASGPLGSSQPEPHLQPKSREMLVWFFAGAAILLAGALAVVFWIASRSTPVDPSKYRHVGDVEYYLYLPHNYTPDREWPLFVGIHGSGGTGRDCWNWWQPYADREGFILLCPSIADSSGGWYQEAGETRVFSTINEVRAQYRVAPQEFLAGFSAGAQFVQGFAFRYPQYVSGVAILSAGNYYPVAFAAHIPMLVVIGGGDDPGAVTTAADFSSTLQRNGFDVQYVVLPGVGHTLTDHAQQLTIELFRRTQTKQTGALH
jgi:predicted esterase